MSNEKQLLTKEDRATLYRCPAVYPPRLEDLTEISESLGFCCTTDELTEYKDMIKEFLKIFDRIDELPTPKLPVKYPRTPGYRPPPEENQYNAWYWKCAISGAKTGPIAGKTVAFKDNMCVAGVPMMCGYKALEGFVPDEDATVVTRVLDAGGRVVGKAACENFSGNSWSIATGPVLNPHDPLRTSGGSSSGCAVLLSTGEIDMAVGGDQGGSIRIPAAWCGVVGLKPTFGLVPYCGAIHIDLSIDTLGPMARTVKECALLLEVIAGLDGTRDPRQPRDLAVPKYSEQLSSDLENMKIGLLTEGFEGCEENVKTVVSQACSLLKQTGAAVEYMSVPMHNDGNSIWAAACCQGMYHCKIQGNGAGYFYKGYYPESIIEKLHDGNKTKAKHFSESTKFASLQGEYITRNYGNKFYAKAQNLTSVLTEAYDKALKKYDVIIMPTLPFTAPLLPKVSTSFKDRMASTLGMTKNTAPFNSTGHPAITINAGESDGLPVGMMIVGKQFDDVTVLKVAYAFEKIKDGA